MTQPVPGPLPAPIPKEAIADVFGTLTNLQCKWANDPQRQLGATGGPQAWLLLSIASYRGKGRDEYRQEYDVVADKDVSSVGGYRLFTVSCRAQSLDFLEPYDILEGLRWGLRTSTGIVGLQTAGLAQVGTANITILASSADNRTLKNAVMDVQLARVSVARPVDDDGNYIETVGGGAPVPVTLT